MANKRIRKKQLTNSVKKTKTSKVKSNRYITYNNTNGNAQYTISLPETSQFNERTLSIFNHIISYLPIKLTIYNITEKDQRKLLYSNYSELPRNVEIISDMLIVSSQNTIKYGRKRGSWDGRFKNNLAWIVKILDKFVKRYRVNTLSSLNRSIKTLKSQLENNQYSAQTVYYNYYN